MKHDSARRQLTEHDRSVLGFAAEHRLVLASQVGRLLGEDVSERLTALVAARLLTEGSVFRERHYQIRAAGLAMINSDLSPPARVSLAAYKHDVGVAWLWLAARAGAFGALAEVLSERRLRSEDGVLERAPEPHGVRLGGIDRFGNERLHYPDLLLIDRGGRRLALELELSAKGRQRRELILGGYGADRRIDRVVYLAEATRSGRAIGRLVESTATEMRLVDRVFIQLVRPLWGPDAEGRPATERPEPARRRNCRTRGPGDGAARAQVAVSLLEAPAR